MTRTIYDIEEEKIMLLSDFLIDLCQAIDSDITEDNLKGRLSAVQVENEKYWYYLDEKIPLLFVDLKLLIDEEKT